MFFPATPPAIVEEIRQNYDAKIESQKVGFDLSLYGCRIEEFQITGKDPVTFEKRTIKLSLYHPRGNQPSKGAVMILPPTGGVNILDRGYANEICTNGMTAALVAGWDHQLDTSFDFEMHNNGARRAIAATRHVIEFLNARNFPSVGLLGTSIGAITGALTFGIDQRVSAVALIVGSARFADVVAESDEAGAAGLRKLRMQKLQMKTTDEYKEAVRKALKIEPSYFLDQVGTRRSFVISADNDTTVPTAYQFELAELLKAETHLKLHGNHLQVIKESFWSQRAAISNFFAKSFNSF